MCAFAFELIYVFNREKEWRNYRATCAVAGLEPIARSLWNREYGRRAARGQERWLGDLDELITVPLEAAMP